MKCKGKCRHSKLQQHFDKTLHGATYGQRLLINEIQNGGRHTCSQDIHDSILGALLLFFQCENDVFFNENDNC